MTSSPVCAKQRQLMKNTASTYRSHITAVLRHCDVTVTSRLHHQHTPHPTSLFYKLLLYLYNSFIYKYTKSQPANRRLLLIMHVLYSTTVKLYCLMNIQL